MRGILLVVAAVPAVAALAIQASSNPLLNKHAEVLKEAKSLNVTFTVQTIPGAPTEYKLTYSKPNLYRIESSKRLIVSDGKTVWDLDKASNTYSENPAPDGVPAITMTDDFWAWSAFFGDQPLKKLNKVTTGRKRKVKSVDVTEVTFGMDSQTPKTGALLIDPATGFARGMNVTSTNGTTTSELLIIGSELVLGTEEAPAATFAFAAPSGAKKAEKPAPGAVSFKQVEAIMLGNCAGCHGSSGPKSGFTASTYEGIMRGGRRGAAVIPGDADNSPLIGYLKHAKAPSMPPGKKLPDNMVQTISDWIKGGAKKE